MKNRILTQFSRPLLFAHRGVSSLAPENTLASFTLARELGIPGIELDIHLCKSGELVVIHDSSLKRTAGGNPDLLVENLTLQELHKYDLGANFKPQGSDTVPKFEPQRIMTLEEVLDLSETLYLDIELKTESMSCEALAKKAAETLNARAKHETGRIGGICRFIVSSFNPIVLYHFKRFSAIPTALIYADDSGVPWYLRGGQGKFICCPDILKPCWKDIFDEKSEYMGKKRPLAKKPSFVWTVDEADTAQRLIELGAQGIISNRPQDILPLIQNT